jgi:hypothetical protein
MDIVKGSSFANWPARAFFSGKGFQLWSVCALGHAKFQILVDYSLASPRLEILELGRPVLERLQQQTLIEDEKYSLFLVKPTNLLRLSSPDCRPLEQKLDSVVP